MDLEGYIKMKPSKNIPTDEALNRASKLMKEKATMLDTVRNKFRQHFEKICPLHEFFILDQRDVDFRAYIFFKTNEDIAACKRIGIHDQMIDFVYAELERVGRGNRQSIKVAVEFDSNENVEAYFERDYYLRLR